MSCHLEIILDHLLGVLVLLHIFLGELTLPDLRYIIRHFGGPKYAILESICISYVDVDHLEIILDHLLYKLVNYFSRKINPTRFMINFDTCGSEISKINSA